ncbi:MAG: undecaprenyl/decaprenyl-phosphate alpha-N-acetylglucosaminyl 1-phosphate transferase [Acidobacteria bacterium]|nr:undecaprenyl/decaprenyl-phosphate alpha-N-acetylglucosaminyl 1-phosphate transferase [Acidobacteriota bacterium]
MILYATGFVLSFVFAYCWTPLMRRAALQLGIVDRPDGKLKSHDAAVPYLGGLAVYAAFLLTVGVLTEFEQETLGYLLAGSIVLIVGLLDDFGVLTPSQKLLGQTLAALVLIKSGIYIKLEFIPSYLALPLTLLWILLVTNAMNIIDVLDGLAAGVASIAALSIAVANVMAGRGSIALLCVILSGACLGFLPHNFHRARIYLGDAGSLYLGFLLGTLSLNAGYTRANLLAVISPVLILGIPLFDLALVMYVRWRNGIPVTKGSPDHFALRLRRCKLSVRETAVTTYVVSAILGCIALVMSQVSFQWALMTLTGTASAGFLSAYLLMKVDMSS